MSSVIRKAPLLSSTTPKGWVIFQKEKNSVVRAWTIHGHSAHPEAMVEKMRSEGALVKEIPATWIALPTGIDLQVHLRFPGQPNKETLEGGLESALYGGYDSVVTMPNTNPFLDKPEILREAISDWESQAKEYPVRVGFTASATVGMQGQEAADITGLARAGAVAITDDGWGVKSHTAQAKIFAECAAHDLLFQQHAETPGHKGVTPASKFQQSQNLPEYPRDAESSMVARDIALLRKNPEARYHILHISTRETLAEIRKAKKAGLRVTAEVTPHHLYFANTDIPVGEGSTNFKMNPPLFDPEDRAALREALRDGTIDCVSTDHAPHEPALKAEGWITAPFGTRGMETALSVLTTLVKEGELSFERLQEVWSSAPRRILNRPEFMDPTGLLFVDPTAEFKVGLQDLPGQSENSCFLGTTLHGRIELRCEEHRIYERAEA
jgi:dihydroorotase